MIFEKIRHRSQFHLRLSFATSASYEGGESGLVGRRQIVCQLQQLVEMKLGDIDIKKVVVSGKTL
jgi:hypothetical protein